MWKNGVGAETPAEYKKRHASESTVVPESQSKGRNEQVDERAWWRRLFFRT